MANKMEITLILLKSASLYNSEIQEPQRRGRSRDQEAVHTLRRKGVSVKESVQAMTEVNS